MNAGVGDFTLEIQLISPWNLVDFNHEIWWISPRFHLWNPPKIIKASVSAETLQFDECRVGDFTLEIQWISPWNLVDFNHEIWWISPRFHLWNPPKIIKTSISAKTFQVDECRVGDFTLKSGGFHPWNLADFTQISPVKSTQNYKSKCFSKNSSVWWMQGGGYDQGFSWNSPWNLVDFNHEIWQISSRFSPVKSPQIIKASVFSKNSSVWWMQGGGFHPRNPVDFTLKSGGFQTHTHEIWWISPRFHLLNPPKIIKASVSAKTLQFDECRVWDFTLEIQWISPWNLVDFNHEIWWISPRFHLWNPPKIIKASISAKTFQVDECRVGDFTLKSGGFQPWNLADFTQISPVKSTQNYKSKCFSKNSSVWWMQGGGYDQGFHEIHPEIWWISPMKSGRFHPDFTCEIHPKL